MYDNLTSQLICTRISHDVAGNIGAVANAVECMDDDDPEFLESIKNTLQISAKVLASRVKFFRLTFGLANENLQNLETVKNTAQDYLWTLGNKDYPIQLNFGDIALDDRPSALMMLMIMADLLIRGGVIAVGYQAGNLCAKISASARISTEKFDTLKRAMSTQEIPANALLAPLKALAERETSRRPVLGCCNDEILLIMEPRHG